MMTEEQRYLFDLCGFLHLRELVESAHYTHEKEIATQQRVCLSQ